MYQKSSVSPLANIRSRCNDVRQKVTQVVNDLVQHTQTQLQCCFSIGFVLLVWL